MRRDDEDIIEYTRRFWSPKYGREITAEEARAMVHRITAFVDLLTPWAAKRVSANENQMDQSRQDESRKDSA